MKKIRYIRSSPQHVIACIDDYILQIEPGDVFKYYFSSSGADFWQGFLFSWLDELYVKAKIMKNSQTGCSFDIAYADTVDGGTSTSSFNYGDIFSITLKINDDYSGSIDIFNETRKQPITNESIQTDI